MNISQDEFDDMYNKGMEENSLSLTDSRAITTTDLIDAAVYRLYFQENKKINEIENILKDKIKNFQKDFKNFL